MISTLRGTFRLAATTAVIVGYGSKILLSRQEKRHDAFKGMIDSLHNIFNIKVNVIGTPLSNTGIPTIYAVNHVSNPDALIVNKAIDRASNIAAWDVQHWPIIGKFAKGLDTVFVKHTPPGLSKADRIRSAQENAAHAQNAVQEKIDGGNSIVVFPEGTMSDGAKLLPFKPTILDVARRPGNEHVAIQPVVLEVARVNGQPVPKGQPSGLRELYAHYSTQIELPDGKKKWVDNKSFWAMIWDMATTKEMVFDLTFLPPINQADHTSKATLGLATREAIGKAMNLEEFRP